MKDNLVVVAIGGNSLIKRQDLCTVEDQYHAICETIEYVADIIEQGYQVVITHGNGPQVGFIMLRSEIARDVAGMHIVPLVSCVADTQGALGYQIQQALDNELRRRSLPGETVTVVTQVEVDKDDPSFSDPNKPIGKFYTDAQLPELKEHYPDWVLKKDANRGWRRMVPSPKPRRIIEKDAIIALLKDGFNVVAVGGGGIPVVRDGDGFKGVDAVIDKDLASSLLAKDLGAGILLISTSVPHVCLNFGTPMEKPLRRVTLSEVEGYLREGHFAPGSMAPKIRAAIYFLKNGGREVIITRPENIKDAMAGEKGSHIVRNI